MLRKFIVSLVVLGGLAACSEQTVYVKPGVSRAQTSAETSQCRVEANRLFPPIWVYDTYGGGWGWGGAGFSYDLNEGRRRAYYADCLNARGFSQATVPVCTNEMMQGRKYAVLERTPKMSPSICITRLDDGSRGFIDLDKPL